MKKYIVLAFTCFILNSCAILASVFSAAAPVIIDYSLDKLCTYQQPIISQIADKLLGLAANYCSFNDILFKY